VQLLARLRQHFDADIALRDLFAEPELADFARALGDHRPLLNLVPIRTAGSQPPLFFVHPAGGEVGYVRDLSPHIDADVPVYGLAATGFRRGETPLGSIAEMAGCYIEQLRAVQPTGPYRLGGWSTGGTVAYEIARQLVEANETVSFLALFDTSCAYGSQDVITATNETATVLQFIPTNVDSDTRTQFERLAHDNDLAGMLALAQQRGLVMQEINYDTFCRHLRVICATIAAVAEYIPLRLPIPATLFAATENVTSTASGWVQRFGEQVRTLAVKGNHQTMMNPPHIVELGHALSTELHRSLTISTSA
jgi:thioesterase domain-containing protein